jgi:lactoylglutathione lyase
MAKVTLSLLVVQTHQLERVRSFYQALGVEMHEEKHGKGPRHYAGFVGNVVFEIYPLPEDGADSDPRCRLGFAVEHMHTLFTQLKESGTPVISEPSLTPWGLRAIVRDPDGRAVELYQQPTADHSTASSK